jgi:N-acetyl-1-D-myo-inositol-2-amino-2-deoxy-alpha-D-glucopyranoside deacetylase
MSLLDLGGRVLFAHAHPDDETLATGALLAELVASGVEVHVLTATRGERGELMPGVPAGDPGTPEFVARREDELARALVALGIHHHAFLGAPPARAEAQPPRIYEDSGMEWVADGVAGPAAGVGPNAFTRESVDEAVADLAALLAEVRPDAVVSYDRTGGYGHPDHVRMHEVTRAAAERTGIPMVEVLPPGRHSSDGEDGVEWLDLSARLGSVQAALRAHATQVRVDGDEVVHAGGQREPIATLIGLRRVPPRHDP